MSYAPLLRKMLRKPELAAPTGSLRIGQPNDAFEREADHVANGMISGAKARWTLNAAHTEGVSEAPPVVHEVLRSPGKPLDAPTRSFFEARFGHDFSRVRVHADSRAAESANAVNANAYTAGNQITFDAGQYAPGTDRGDRLLAHELTHVLQQRGGAAGGLVQRDDKKETPCLISDECSKPIPGSSWDFAQKVAEEREESRKSAEAIRKGEKEKEQEKTPPKQEVEKPPGKQEKGGGGHVEVTFGELQEIDTGPPGSADFLKKIVNAEDRTLLTNVYDVIVDPSLASAAGGLTTHCELVSPPPQDAPDARCINVPRALEEGAKKYDSGDKTIDGKSRYDWFTEALSTVRHEKSHVEFEQSPPVGKGRTFNVQKVFNYSPDIYRYDLGELNSIISEFQVHYERSKGSKDDRDRSVRKFLVDYINNQHEGIRGILKKLRCIATCDEVDDGIRKVLDRRILSKGEAEIFFKIVRDPAQKLDWPK